MSRYRTAPNSITLYLDPLHLQSTCLLLQAGGAVTLAVAEAKLRREVEQEKSEEAMAMDSVLTLNSARTEALMVGADLHPHLVWTARADQRPLTRAVAAF